MSPTEVAVLSIVVALLAGLFAAWQAGGKGPIT